jgi:hypothetical protein
LNINKLLKDWPKLLERMDKLEQWYLETHKVDSAPAAITLAPIVSERSLATKQGYSIGEERTRNKRGSTRRN